MKEEKLEVAGGNGGKCWRGKLLSALCLTGEIFKSFPMKVLFEIFKVWETDWEYVVLNLKEKYFSETWILPLAVLLAMVAYAVLAIVFYNTEG